MRNQVSLCMIVKNEEYYLPKCLGSIKDIVDEIIIVDTGSTDKTIDIAKSFSAKVYQYQWNNNFSEARNESLKYATKDWILILDADDELFKEDSENFKILLDSELDEKAIYYFETLSYYGNSIDDSHVTVNLNPRLFKNNRAIYYQGEVHNQLVYPDIMYNAICKEIKIHHYGYLDKSIASKNKRERNIALLEKQLMEDPLNPFVCFNMGNEYAASDNKKMALEFYYKAYDKFDPHVGFGPLLLLRIVIINYSLKEYETALEFIETGIKHYPAFTELYFFRGLIYKDMRKPILQIEAFEKCIELGESASEIKYFLGAGSFQAYFELGNVYYQLNDYEKASYYYKEAMKVKTDFVEPLPSFIKIIKKDELPLNELNDVVSKCFTDTSKVYFYIANLFYNESCYETALECLIICENSNLDSKDLVNLKAKCFLMTGAFDNCININSISEENEISIYLSMLKVLSGLLSEKYEYVSELMSNVEENNLSDFDKKLFKVYQQLVKLLRGESGDILSSTENEDDYLNIIFEIYEVMLTNKKLEEFDKAIELLNFMNNKYVLLYLGKTYYKYGYLDLAKKELLRSIKEFEIYDAEALDILKILS